MTILKALLTIAVSVFFAISFMTFDMAALNLDLPAGTLVRENPVVVGVLGGFLLIALIADRRLNYRRVS